MTYSNDDDDMESGGEDNYLSDNDDSSRDSDDGFDMEDDSIKNQSHEVGYVVLKEEDIRKRQKDDIERVSTLLCVTQVESIALLLYYRWSVGKVEDEWFTDEERVRKLVGIFKKPLVDSNGVEEIDCGICFESYGRNEIESVSCGHPYCVTCWTGYVESKINDGLGCLTVKCPEPSCSAVVGQDLILRFSKEEEEKEKYDRFLLRSYVEDSGKKKIKWCPSPGCNYAIDLSNGCENYDVSCLCSNSFCWNCSEEAHRPVDCETVAKWILKNSDESENTNWIFANTKPCPKCKRQIEKNQGCNSMTCSKPCGHRFCWICLQPNTDHPNACNMFKRDDGDGDGDGDDNGENRRQRARDEIERYAHYYERWANNETSSKRAMKDLEKLQSLKLKVLSQRQSMLETQLQFTVEAWLQIVECRRVLKWTYAYGYYLAENEQAKREFFEYLQGEAEVALEKLHHCVETELDQFLFKSRSDVPSSASFADFRTKLIGLTKVNKTYFENLVTAWENGLEDEECKPTNSSNKRRKIVQMVRRQRPSGN